MDMKTYHEASASTAIYPIPILKETETEMGYIYPILGLISEYSEFQVSCLEEGVSEVLAEAGDVLWYIHSVIRELSIDLSEFEQLVKNPDKFMWSTPFNDLNAISGCTKKAIRDLEGDFSKEYIQKVTNSLASIHYRVESACIIRGSNIEDCRQYNSEKLRSRANRGVLSGDGGNR